MNKIRPISLSRLIIAAGIISLVLSVNNSTILASGSATDNSFSLSSIQTNTTAITFGSLELGQSLNQTIQLSNNDSEAIKIDSIQLNLHEGIFSWDETEIILAQDETYDLVIMFAPEAELYYSATLTIETNTSSSTNVLLSGSGVSFPIIFF